MSIDYYTSPIAGYFVKYKFYVDNQFFSIIIWIVYLKQ